MPSLRKRCRNVLKRIGKNFVNCFRPPTEDAAVTEEPKYSDEEEPCKTNTSPPTAEFISGDGQTIHLDSNQTPGPLEITSGSSVWIINKSDYDLAYLMISKGSTNLKCIKMCHKKTDAVERSQPMLVNSNIDQIFLGISGPNEDHEDWTQLPCSGRAMIECVANGRPVLIDSSACPNTDGYGVSITLTNRNIDLILERVTTPNEDCCIEDDGTINRQSIKFQNDLPYDVILEILDGDVTETLKHLKAGDRTLLTPKENSVLAVHLCYLDKKWIFSQGIYSLESSKVCDFVSEDGEIIQLGNSCLVDNNKHKVFTVFSPVWIVNKTDVELAYLQFHGADNNQPVVKTYDSPNRDSQQPVLLNYDINQLYLACADRLRGRENWTRLPLDGSYDVPIELITHNKFRSVHSFVTRNPNVIGMTIVLTDHENDQITDDIAMSLNGDMGESDIADIVVCYFYNSLANRMCLETFLDGEMGYTILHRNERGTWNGSKNSIVTIYLEYMDQNWTFRETAGNLRNLETWNFVSETGKVVALGCLPNAFNESTFTFTVFGPIEMMTDS